MCELFAYSSENSSTVINNYLKEFYGRSNTNPHGWGFAVLNGNEAVIEKEPMQATKSNYLKERLSQPIAEKNVFAHIRYATIGNIEFRNCHPFSKKDNRGRRWTLIHNGTIFDYPPLHKYVKLQKGDTDSERILLYLIDKINQTETGDKTLNSKERFTIIDCLIGNMAKGNKLNLVLYDGEYTYIHTNYRDSLYYLQKQGEIFFATYPFTNEEWQPVPFTRLLIYKDGKLVYEGQNHNNEYLDSEENMKFIYQIFSEL
ncbi:class II glutamine amidotransferase [Eubacterium oxidoreducens]|uniref:Glutamine amidotransferase n=1 Tax=Eubacterium oxidoreducens TaxID=1732 RepID=A0A1G6A371_EUBOX|nr:class II glutamine amidotransferase [Eubacterium oxidoreducens]SDB02443.1 glutamine amidotransferase [Eubacterium oxidoreducens]